MKTEAGYTRKIGTSCREMKARVFFKKTRNCSEFEYDPINLLPRVRGEDEKLYLRVCAPTNTLTGYGR
jgi:hypothetical protein